MDTILILRGARLTAAADCCIVASVKFLVALTLAATPGLTLFVAPLAAHHSFSAQFDANKQIKLEGTITKINWGNPHVWFFIDVKDASGEIASWACETNGPNGLIRQGWKRDALKVGDKVIIDAYLARDGTKTVDARSVTFPNGSKVFTGSASDGGPRPNQ